MASPRTSFLHIRLHMPAMSPVRHNPKLLGINTIALRHTQVLAIKRNEEGCIQSISQSGHFLAALPGYHCLFAYFISLRFFVYLNTFIDVIAAAAACVSIYWFPHQATAAIDIP